MSEQRSGGWLWKVVIAIVGIGLIASAFDGAGTEIEIDGSTAKLEWRARINLANEGALKAIVHTMGTEVYEIAKKHPEVDTVEVSLYYVDLEDRYGNEIPIEDALDSRFVLRDLDEVRRYSDGLAYAMDNEVFLAYFVITGNYSYLWKG